MNIIENLIIENINCIKIKVDENTTNFKYYNDLSGEMTLVSENVPNEFFEIDLNINDDQISLTYCKFECYNINNKMIDSMNTIISNVEVTSSILQYDFIIPKDYPVVSPNIFKMESKINVVVNDNIVDNIDNTQQIYVIANDNYDDKVDQVDDPHETNLNYNKDYDRGFEDGLLIGGLIL